jgi:hypothetical protein
VVVSSTGSAAAAAAAVFWRCEVGALQLVPAAVLRLGGMSLDTVYGG